jgi:hypothetical protein
MNNLLRHITTKKLIVSAAILLCSFLFLNALHHPVSILTIKKLSGGHTILNLLPFYNATIGYEYLESYTSEAVAIYRRVLLFDLIILIPAYVAFFICGIGYYGKSVLHNKKLLSGILVLPIVAALLNLAEDAIVWFLLHSLPVHFDNLMTISGVVTTIKLFIFIVCFVLVVVFFVLFTLRGAKTLHT